MTTMRERVEQDDITAEAEWSDSPPSWAHGERERGDWYRVTLKRGSRRLTVPFTIGKGPPEAADVLNALADDAATWDNANGFEDWAGELGFNARSRAAKATYRRVEALTAKLRAFLGDQYDDYLYETARG
jgi:hypothetical protein